MGSGDWPSALRSQLGRPPSCGSEKYQELASTARGQRSSTFSKAHCPQNRPARKSPPGEGVPGELSPKWRVPRCLASAGGRGAARAGCGARSRFF